MMLMKYLKIQAGIQSVEQSNTDKKGIYDTLMQYKSTIINTTIGGLVVGGSLGFGYWMGNKNQDKTTCNNKQHHSLSDDLKGKQEEVDQLKSKEEKLQEQIKDLQTKLEKQIKSNKSPLDTTAESKNEEIEHLQEQLGAREKQIQALNKELQALKAQLGEQEEQIKGLKAKLANQMDSNKSHEQDLQEQLGEKETLQAQVEELNQQLENQIESNELNKESLQAQLGEKETLQAQVEELNQQLENQIKINELNKESLQAQLAELENEKQEQIEELNEKLKNQIKINELNKESLQEQLGEKETLAQQNKQLAEEAGAKLNALCQEVEHLYKEIDKLEQQNKELNEKIKIHESHGQDLQTKINHTTVLDEVDEQEEFEEKYEITQLPHINVSLDNKLAHSNNPSNIPRLNKNLYKNNNVTLKKIITKKTQHYKEIAPREVIHITKSGLTHDQEHRIKYLYECSELSLNERQKNMIKTIVFSHKTSFANSVKKQSDLYDQIVSELGKMFKTSTKQQQMIMKILKN